MSDRTLYVTDLDGTLLGPNAQLSEFAARTLSALMDDGVLITCATGRSWLTVKRVLGNFRFRLPVILNDGTFTYDADRDVLLDQHLLPDHVTSSIIGFCRDKETPPIVYGMESSRERVSWVVGVSNPGTTRFFDGRPADPRNAPCDRWDQLPTRGIFGIVATGEPHAVDALAAQIRTEVGEQCEVTVQQDTYHPEDTWMAVVPAHVSKATALTRLAATLGANRLVVFGDNMNDLPMFDVATESYAVSNAAAAVRAAATSVIGSNSEDGVARWLAEFAATSGEDVVRSV